MSFLRGIQFATLIAPRDTTAFFSEHWDRQPMLERRGLPDFYDGLLTLEDVERVLAVNARNGGNSAPNHLDVDAALRRMEQGAALVLAEAQQQIEGLALLCRVVHAELTYRCTATLEITMPSNKPRPPEPVGSHAFVLQLRGRRRWLIENSGANTADLPSEFVMDTGDLLYLPPGTVVQRSTTGDESVIAILTMTVPRWVDMTGSQALANDPTLPEALAAALPSGWLRVPRQQLVAELSRRWRQADDMMAVEAAVAQMVETEVRAFPIDMRGRLTEVLTPTEIRAETVFGARRDLLWFIERAGEVNRLIAGPLTIDLADDASDAVAFCLSEERYTVGEIPGTMDPVARLALVDRLARTMLIRRISG